MQQVEDRALSLSRFSISGVMPPAADHLNNGGKLEEPTQRDVKEGRKAKRRGERREINENGGGGGGGGYKDACSLALSHGGRRPVLASDFFGSLVLKHDVNYTNRDRLKPRNVIW